MSLDPARLAPMANAIRALAMDAVQAANSGHPGMPMGMADVASVLWSQYIKFDPAAPKWPDRDRFVLSAGHGSMLLYSVLHLTGYAHPTIAEIRNFRQFGSPCAGHPENTHLDGVEATTGPLGQGIGNAVGFALSGKRAAATSSAPSGLPCTAEVPCLFGAPLPMIVLQATSDGRGSASASSIARATSFTSCPSQLTTCHPVAA
jgi:transketolase